MSYRSFPFLSKIFVEREASFAVNLLGDGRSFAKITKENNVSTIIPIKEANTNVDAIPKNLIQNLRPPKDLLAIKELFICREFSFAILDEKRLEVGRYEESFINKS